MGLPAFCDARVEFVVLAWNSEAVIGSCVDSVLALECACLDLWVVDNGSTDATPRILAEVAARDQRLHVITEPTNLGTTVSRNKALRRVSGDSDYVCVLDSDTVVCQRAFDTMADALRSDPSLGVVGPEMVSSSGKVQLSGRSLPTLAIKLGKVFPVARVAKWAAEAERPHAPILGGLQDVGYLLSACWFMPRSSLERVGLLDERIFYAPEDVDWCLRCHKAGLRVTLCHRACISHEYQRLSHKKMLSRINFEHVKGLIYYFIKHRYLFHSPSYNGLS